MKKHLTSLMAIAVALGIPLSAMAQDAVDSANAPVASENTQTDSAVATDNANAVSNNDAASVEAKTDAAPVANNDAKSDDATVADSKSDDKKEDKSWSIGAAAAFDLGLGAFQKDEHAKKIRSRFAFAINGSYTIPVIDVDIHAETGFSQWMSTGGGSNGKHEFRWADSVIGLSRDIWSYKNGGFQIGFDADLSFAIPTSTASINTDLYTTIAPTLGMTIVFHKLEFKYNITYGHSFHKYTSTTLDPSEVDVISRSTGNELIGTHDIAVGGVLTEIELANLFQIAYKFVSWFKLGIGFGFADAWTYDNGTITKDDEFVNQNAKVGRGHSQVSQGIVALNFIPHEWVILQLAMTSTQPWKTADNKTLRFPWFDTVSPSKNFTKFVFTASFQY